MAGEGFGNASEEPADADDRRARDLLYLNTYGARAETRCCSWFRPDPRQALVCGRNGAWRSLVARVLWEH